MSFLAKRRGCGGARDGGGGGGRMLLRVSIYYAPKSLTVMACAATVAAYNINIFILFN